MERSKVIEKKKIISRRKSGKNAPRVRRRKRALALNLLMAAVAALIVLGVFLFVLIPMLSSSSITRSPDGKSFIIRENIDKSEPGRDIFSNPGKNKQ